MAGAGPRHLQGRRPPGPREGSWAEPGEAAPGPVAAASRYGWVPRHEHVVWAGPGFDVVETHLSSPEGRTHKRHVVRGQVLEVACVVVDHLDRVALVSRYGFGTQRRGWELPTTEVHNGGNILTAAQRLMEQECGWSIQTPRLDRRLARWPAGGDMGVQVVAARAHAVSGSPLSRDIDEVDWFNRAAAAQSLGAGHVEDAVTAACLYRWLGQRPGQP